MKNCLVLGSKSDIAKGLMPMLERDGWSVSGWNRETPDSEFAAMGRWDLVLCALGTVAPVGYWWNQPYWQFDDCFEANILLPMRLLRTVWSKRNPESVVCFMGGSNPQRIMDGYAPYNASKMGLLKLVEQLDHESPDCRIFALGPGYVRDSKIHQPTLEANWPNERIARGDAGTPIERIYEGLKWCIAQDKSVVGGRNVCASDAFGPQLAALLKSNQSMFKLRRIE